MMPLAALVSGTFISNPLMKIPLMLYGGASLFNTVGQEALAEYRKENGSNLFLVINGMLMRSLTND